MTQIKAVVTVEMESIQGHMMKLYFTARIHAPRQLSLRRLKIDVFSCSRTKDCVTRMPLILSAMYAVRFDCLLLCICQARRCLLLTKIMTLISTGSPHRQIKVSLTCSANMNSRIKIKLHKSVMVLMIPLDNRSLKLLTQLTTRTCILPCGRSSQQEKGSS